MKQKNTFYPTNKCFDDCIEYLEALFRENKLPPTHMLLCHGIVKIVNTQKEYAHAWLEDLQNNHVLEFKIDDKGEKCALEIPRKAFYEVNNMREFTAYSMEGVAHNNLIHCTQGPWKDRYLEMCRNFKNRNYKEHKETELGLLNNTFLDCYNVFRGNRSLTQGLLKTVNALAEMRGLPRIRR